MLVEHKYPEATASNSTASNLTTSTMTSNSNAIPKDGTFIAMDDSTLRMAAMGLPTRTEVPPNSGTMAGGIGYFPPKSEKLDEIMTVLVTTTKSKLQSQAESQSQSQSQSQPPSAQATEKQGFMGKLKGLMGSSASEKKDRGGEGRLRVVYMPRREYLKYFARDQKRNYVGTEPERAWTDEELDAMFKQYEPAAAPKPMGTLADKLLAPLGGGMSL